MKCLIVDDHPRMRAVVKAALEGIADTCGECADGAQVIAAYRDCLPDWVLMDIEMPNVDGLEATRHLRAQFPGARVVIVTNHDSPELRAQAVAVGACGYVHKDDLASLRSILGGNGDVSYQSTAKNQ